MYSRRGPADPRLCPHTSANEWAGRHRTLWPPQRAPPESRMVQHGPHSGSYRIILQLHVLRKALVMFACLAPSVVLGPNIYTFDYLPALRHKCWILCIPPWNACWSGFNVAILYKFVFSLRWSHQTFFCPKNTLKLKTVHLIRQRKAVNPHHM